MDRLTLELTRVLPAPRPVVFAAFRDPDALVRWWGPEGFSVRAEGFDPRTGGAYRLAMQPPDGEAFHVAGVFREVDVPERLAFTFAWEPPDPDDVENLVRLSFAESAGYATEVTMTQAPFRTEDRLELHRAGWSESFDKLERMLPGAT